MNAKKILSASAAMVMMLVACDNSYLDQTVITDLDENVIFSDSAYAAGFLSQIYAEVGYESELNRFGKGGLQVACDEAEFKQSSDISTGMAFATGTVNPVIVTSDAWQKCYSNIRRCNKFLGNIDRAPMVTSAKEGYKAEARFLRAWYYASLLRHYGGVPIIGDTCYNLGDELKTTRDTYADCVDYVVGECRDIIKTNLLRPRNTGRNNGRASEAACRGLIARVLLTAASPLHNGSGFGTPETQDLLGYPTYDKERWRDAYQASKDVMTMSGDYRLYSVHKIEGTGDDEPGWGYYAMTFPADFVSTTAWTDSTGVTHELPYGPYHEVIFEKKGAAGVGVFQMLDATSCGGNGSGGYIYLDLADSYPMADGKPIGQGKYTYDPVHPQLNRDPRYLINVIYDGCVKRSGTTENYTVRTCTGDVVTQDEVHNGTPTGLFIRKHINRNCAANYFVGSPECRNIISFAEILLNYAEAANEYYGPNFTETIGGQQMGPLEALKLIRERAGIEAGDDGMYGLQAGMTQEEMREAIRLERRIELAFEGYRFFDVRRWMIAEQTDNRPMHGSEITISGSNATFREFVVRTHVFRKGMYFFPIPYNETVKSPELIQNPYYD